MPFDTKTPIGYGVTGVIEILSLVIICYTVMLALDILVTYFGLVMSFADESQRKIRDINDNLKIPKNDTKVLNLLYDVISFTSDAKRLNIHRMRVHFNSFLIDLSIVFLVWMVDLRISMNLTSHFSMSGVRLPFVTRC